MVKQLLKHPLEPGERMDVIGKFQNNGGPIHVKLFGDRRLVLLETAFE